MNKAIINLMSKQTIEILALGKEMGDMKTKMSCMQLEIQYLCEELSKQGS